MGGKTRLEAPEQLGHSASRLFPLLLLYQSEKSPQDGHRNVKNGMESLHYFGNMSFVKIAFGIPIVAHVFGMSTTPAR